MRKSVLVLAVLSMSLSAFADEWKEEIREAKRRIVALRAEAGELERAGRGREARKLREKAEQLQERIMKAIAHRKRGGREGREVGPERLQGVLRGLVNGIEALTVLGRHEEAEHLKRITADVKRRLAQHKPRSRGADKERAVAREYIKTMRIAMHALLEADKSKAAHQAEQAIHAMELRLSGRRDAEARKIIAGAPKAGQMAELLGHAAEILADMKHKEMAGRVRKLASVYKRQWERQRKGRRSERKRAVDPDRRERRKHEVEREHRERAEHFMERVEQLEKRLDEVTALLEQLVRQMERQKR